MTKYKDLAACVALAVLALIAVSLAMRTACEIHDGMQRMDAVRAACDKLQQDASGKPFAPAYTVGTVDPVSMPRPRYRMPADGRVDGLPPAPDNDVPWTVPLWRP